MKSYWSYFVMEDQDILLVISFDLQNTFRQKGMRRLCHRCSRSQIHSESQPPNSVAGARLNPQTDRKLTSSSWLNLQQQVYQHCLMGFQQILTILLRFCSLASCHMVASTSLPNPNLPRAASTRTDGQSYLCVLQVYNVYTHAYLHLLYMQLSYWSILGP